MNSDLEFQFRIGKVSAVFPERHTAKVFFEDNDNVVSAELPILVPFTGKNKVYALPDVNDSVACISQLNSETEGDGFILGSFYNDVDKPKANNQEICRLDFGDGSFFEFDRATGNFEIHCTGEIKITGAKIFLN